MKNFKLEMGARVQLAQSGESGEIIGRAQYAQSESRYLVRYVAADGRLTEGWWDESAITA